MLTIDGLVTGLDTTSIVEGLLSIQQARIDQLQSQQADIAAEQSAFKGIEAQLLSLRSSLSSLAKSGDSALNAKVVTSSDDTLVKAAASSDAAVGVYSLEVSSVAQAHQIATQGYASSDAAITHGTFDLQVGSGTTTSLTVDSTNDTLQGLADAINASEADVSATIINDGSTGGTPYRLLLTSSKTGASNGISVTNNLAADNGGAIRPDLSGPAIQDATDASVKLGSGAGAITVTSENNQFDNLIDGVTIDVLAAEAGKSITLTVAGDVEGAKSAVTGLVDSFNAVMSFIDDQVRFVAESEDVGPLLGNQSAIFIQDRLRQAFLGVVGGVNTQMNRLSALGVSVGDNGRLTLDESQLDDVLSGRVEGVTVNDVHRLFALDGVSDNGGVQFLLGSSRTKESTTPYQVDISQAAERASITATNQLAASTVIDSSNNTITLTVDGAASATLTLNEGTYTRQELADHLESVINADDELLGRSVDVNVDSDALRITSNSYGLTSEVTIGTGTAQTILGFDGTESDNGQDVVGKFIVDGKDEIAKGTGRLLVGDPDNENTADLQVRVTLSSSQVQAGHEASITVTRGLASTLDNILGDLLDPITGRVKAVNDGYDDRIAGIDESIADLNELFEQRQAALVAEFVAMESAVNQFQSLGNLLTTQLAGISALTTSGGSGLG